MRRWMMLGGALALLLAAGGPGAASAGTADGKFAVEGVGRVDCAAFLKARTDNAPVYAAYLGFIQGYLTAANRYEPDTFDLTPWQSADAFGLIIATHCQKSPTDSLGVVAQKLVVGLTPKRLTAYSDLLLIGEGKDRRPIYSTVLTQTQAELAKKRLYTGPADGKYSPALGGAIREFQKSVKLKETGMPDTATLWMLFNP